MSKRTSYHIVPHEKGWAIRREGCRRASSVHSSQREALERARHYASKHAPSDVIVHDKEGEIRETRSIPEDYAFLRTAKALKLQGPRTWSTTADIND
jgi:hypothetical protein